MQQTKYPKRYLSLFSVAAAIIAFCFLASAPAHAGSLAVSFSPLGNVAPGATNNSFDVLLTNTGTDVDIAGFSFEVLSSSTDITFTDATSGSTTPYIFGITGLFSPDIINPGSTPGSSIGASDLATSSDALLQTGDVVSLGRVFFDVSPTAAPQTVYFSFSGFPGTSLSDDFGLDIPIDTFFTGQFSITGSTSPVPEPTPFVLLAATVSLFAIFRWPKRLARRVSGDA